MHHKLWITVKLYYWDMCLCACGCPWMESVWAGRWCPWRGGVGRAGGGGTTGGGWWVRVPAPHSLPDNGPRCAHAGFCCARCGSSSPSASTTLRGSWTLVAWVWLRVCIETMVTSCEIDLQQQRHHQDYLAATEAAAKEHAVLGMILPECECWPFVSSVSGGMGQRVIAWCSCSCYCAIVAASLRPVSRAPTGDVSLI